jgi:hypothetical protein
MTLNVPGFADIAAIPVSGNLTIVAFAVMCFRCALLPEVLWTGMKPAVRCTTVDASQPFPGGMRLQRLLKAGRDQRNR